MIDPNAPAAAQALPSPLQFTARLEEREDHSERFIELHFEMDQPHELHFAAGQYISIKVDEIGTRRSYSICSTPAVAHGFELLVELVPEGKGSTFLNALQLGDRIQALGPLGRFVIADQPESAIVLVATGSGISPIKSMLENLVQDRRDSREITLYWGMRYIQDWFWLDEIEDMVEETENVHFYPVLSKPGPEWTLSTGHVTDLLEQHTFDMQTGFYVCGSKQMTQSTEQLLLAKGVRPELIHHEQFD